MTSPRDSMLLIALLTALVALVHCQRGPSAPLCRQDTTDACDDLQTTPHLCYEAQQQRACCQTCWKLAKVHGIGFGCELGDRDPHFCRFVTMRQCRAGVVQERCCETCLRYIFS